MPTPGRGGVDRTHSPAAARACRPSACHAVRNTSGTAAARIQFRLSGTRMSCTAGTATRSAYPPPDRSAIARSPSLQPVTPAPMRSTVGGLEAQTSLAPGGGGVVSATLQDVRAVDGRGADAQHHLTLGGLRVGHGGQLQHLGTPGGGW